MSVSRTKCICSRFWLPNLKMFALRLCVWPSVLKCAFIIVVVCLSVDWRIFLTINRSEKNLFLKKNYFTVFSLIRKSVTMTRKNSSNMLFIESKGGSLIFVKRSTWRLWLSARISNSINDSTGSHAISIGWHKCEIKSTIHFQLKTHSEYHSIEIILHATVQLFRVWHTQWVMHVIFWVSKIVQPKMV